MSVDNSLWSGIYNSFAEAGGNSDAFDSDIWINKQVKGTIEAVKQYEFGNFLSKDYPLSIVASMALANKKSLKILDFGGGMGLQYLELLVKLPESESSVDYYVVDAKSSIENRPKELDRFKKLYFSFDLDDVAGQFDIIHIGSTLQYIEDWQSLLIKLNTKYVPQYFVFSDLLAGEIPTFISKQVFYNKKIPITMINIEEFICSLTQLFFKPIYRAYFQVPILGQLELPNFALPEKFRLKHSCNMIFRRLA